MCVCARTRACVRTHGNICVIHEGPSLGVRDLCQGAVGAQKWAPQAKASRRREEIQVRPRLRLSRSLFYPGSARSQGGPWPGGEYPRILSPYAPILCPPPTMGSTASVFLVGWVWLPLSDSSSLQQGGHGDPGPPGAPVSDRALASGGGTGVGPH